MLSLGAWHVLMNDAAAGEVKAAVRTGVERALLDPAFEEDGAYGGMRGGPGNGWDYSWGSNRAQASYGAVSANKSCAGVSSPRAADDRARNADVMSIACASRRPSNSLMSSASPVCAVVSPSLARMPASQWAS